MRAVVLCALLLGAACENATTVPTSPAPPPQTPLAPAPPPPPPPSPPPPSPPGSFSNWQVKSTFTSVTGESCATRDEGVKWSRLENIGERLPLRVEQSDAIFRLHRDWGPFGMEYEGERVDLDFAATAPLGPPRVFKCSDGTLFDDVLCRYEVVGRFSADERELTAVQRYLCRRLGDDLDVLTVSWEWTGTRN